MDPALEPAIDERFVRASGPGGQNVNKVATAVELRFDLDRAPLAEDVKRRLISLAGRRMIDDRVLVIDSRAHRTQGANREEARERLAALIDLASRPPRKRKPTRPKAAAKEKRLESKKRRGAVKAGRQRRGGDD